MTRIFRYHNKDARRWHVLSRNFFTAITSVIHLKPQFEVTLLTLRSNEFQLNHRYIIGVQLLAVVQLVMSEKLISARLLKGRTIEGRISETSVLVSSAFEFAHITVSD